MTKQLYIFVENRPGRLKSVAEALFRNGVNIIAFTIQDRGDFGVMKLLVDRPEPAQLILANKGFACSLKEVLVISVKDKPGNLYRLAAVLMENKINISDAHGFVTGVSKQGICCLELETKNFEKIRKILAKEKFQVLEDLVF